MVSAPDVAVDKRLYVSRQSESVVKSAYVSVTTDRTLYCIVRSLNYVFLNSFAVFLLIQRSTTHAHFTFYVHVSNLTTMINSTCSTSESTKTGHFIIHPLPTPHLLGACGARSASWPPNEISGSAPARTACYNRSCSQIPFAVSTQHARDIYLVI